MSAKEEDVRRNWSKLTEAQQSAFLHAIAVALIETKRAQIWPAHTAAGSQWTAGSLVAKQTLGHRFALPHVLWIAAVAGAVGIFFIGLHWAIAGAGAIVLLFVASKAMRVVTKSQVVSAATVSPDAFGKLWDVGLIALKISSSPNVFAKPGTGVRWQDVVLMELGWDECVQHVPLSRESAMKDIVSRVMGSQG